MLRQVQIDRCVLYGFIFLMIGANLAVFLGSWKNIVVGKNDFLPLYVSAQMIREGQASRLYDFAAENNFIHRVSDVERAPNNHMPYENLIFVPFTYLRFAAAYVLWTLLSIGLVAGVALVLRDLRAGESMFWSNFLSILAFFPVTYCLLQGQDSILLLLLFTLSFWFWRRGQDDIAGFVLALGLFRPQLVLPFLLVALLGGKWKFARGFIPGLSWSFLCLPGWSVFTGWPNMQVS